MLIEARKNICISNYPPGFEEQVKADLKKIKENPIGKRLIEKIEVGAHPVYIKYVHKGSKCAPCNIPSARDPKKGSASRIFYAPADRHNVFSNQFQPLRMPNFVTLVHELIHAYHNSRGKDARTHHYRKLVWTNDEEYHTIMGFPSKKPHRQTPKITENAFRIAQGLSPRFGHFSSAELQDNPVLAAHIKRLAIRNLKTEGSLSLDKRIPSC